MLKLIRKNELEENKNKENILIQIFSEPCMRMDRPRSKMIFFKERFAYYLTTHFETAPVQPIGYCNEMNKPFDLESFIKLRLKQNNLHENAQVKLHVENMHTEEVLFHLSSSDVLITGKSTFCEMPSVGKQTIKKKAKMKK